MISLLIILLSNTNSQQFKIPAFAAIEIVEKGNEDLCEDLQYSTIKDNCDKNPEEFGGPERCNAVADAYKGFKCISSEKADNINSVLAQIDKSSELLLIINSFSSDIKIDFNYLPSQMAVIYMPSDITETKLLSITKKIGKSNFDGSNKNINNFIRSITKDIDYKTIKNENDDEEVIETLPVIRLVGNIKDKVSYLLLTATDFEIIESDLNIHTLCLYAARYLPTQYKIQTKYIISYIYAHESFVEHQIKDYSLVNTENFQLWTMDDKTTINFKEKKLEAIYEDKYIATVPYDIFKKTSGLISFPGEITLNAESNSVVHDNFNITIYPYELYMGPVGLINYDLVMDSSAKLLQNKKSIKVEKSKVIIKKTGSYWDDSKKPKIVINADPDICDVDTTDIDNYAQVTTNPIYSFGDVIADAGGEKEESSNENRDEKPKDDGKGKLSKTAIIGIAVGCAAFVIIVVIIVVVVVIRTKRKRVTG